MFASLAYTQDLCTIEGIATDAQSGAPIPNVTLMLQGSGPPRVFSSASDAAGKFALKGIVPGPYRVTAIAEGYARRSLPVRCGDPGYKLNFALSHQAVISGLVLGEDGQPVRGARVTLLRIAYVGGDKRFMTVSATTPNAGGEFRFDNLADATYFLVASAPGLDVPTFYPSAIDAPAAAPIRIRGPGEIGGADIRLQKTRAFSIRGTLLPGGADAALQDFTIRLLPSDLRVPPTVTRDAKGHFEFRGVLPGSYTLIARRTGAPSPSARLNVDVTDADLDNVDLRLQAGLQVTGSLALDDKDQHPGLAAQASLYSLDNLEYIRAPVTNNRFTFTDIAPGMYRASVQPLPPAAYVKALRVDSRDVPDWAADLTASIPHSIEFVLAFDGGSIAGFVRNARGDPVPKTMVTLVPAGSAPLTTPRFAIGASDDQGRYTFTSVEPGAYKVFAWEKVNPGAIQNRETLRQFETQCADVQVQPNGTANADVTVISASATASIE